MCGVAIAARAQAPQPIPIDSATRAFAQAHVLCAADAGRLWGVSLCGPISFVDAPSRSIVASQGDTKGVLSEKDGVGENAQLDEMDGRYYMLLEWRALDEGLAEYAGVRVGNATAELRTEMALHDLSAACTGDLTLAPPH